ncbi:MAG: phosphoribosyl-AMP cyclohydrolase, partial [Planctomycetes bacterium]|nr:phosphoribosyl-AMP cyclohydrolase [Planctomycetota bacterium]
MQTYEGPDFSKTELIPVIAQDAATGDVLMLAYMNETAFLETLETGRVCYYSRSRKKL